MFGFKCLLIISSLKIKNDKNMQIMQNMQADYFKNCPNRPQKVLPISCFAR